MIIKKFLGKTEQEAIENAKKELGANVVVMNVKNVKRKGLFGFLKPQMKEVTVALEEENTNTDTVSAEMKAAVSAINNVVVSSMNNAQGAATEAQSAVKPQNAAKTQIIPEEVAEKKDNNALEEKLDGDVYILSYNGSRKKKSRKRKKSVKLICLCSFFIQPCLIMK